MKIYNCVICGVECTGIPDDQMLYHLELCGGDTCFDKYMSRPTTTAQDASIEADEAGFRRLVAYGVIDETGKRL